MKFSVPPLYWGEAEIAYKYQTGFAFPHRFDLFVTTRDK